eukprot:TRINITY_DN42149_c0_g1_i1.p1 TRINITY_DN42149_c0_g1~~TRINITY_DN42149_c0_g1_i1.p1  ORF type:complete len:243 (+),score=49.60 TRINITY_DN42149_c0_g1_i1:44-772(+)
MCILNFKTLLSCVHVFFFFFLRIRRPPRSTLSSSSAASDVYKRQVQQALLSRRTIGRFINKEVSETIVRDAVQAAIMAPNHKKTEPWRIVQLGPSSRDVLAELVCEHITKTKGDSTLGQRKAKAWRDVPGWLVFLCRGQSINETHTHMHDGQTSMDYTQLEDYAAVCCAIHNAGLSLHGSGVSSKWSTGAVTRAMPFRELVGAQSDELVVGTLMFGYRKQNASPLPMPVKRMGVDDVLTIKP